MGLQTANAARAVARMILREGRFHQSSVPRPLHGVVEAVGKVLSDPFNALNHLVERIGKWFPGGVAGVWALLVLLVLAGVGALSARRAKARLGEGGLAHRERNAGPAGPAELEWAAAGAEREGRLADAVRLRFRAGLARLSHRAGFPSPQTTPTHEVAVRLGSERFDRLARRFDEITYGGAGASLEDVAEQRREWPLILSGSGEEAR